MTDLWKQCEGQIINSTFPLQQFLGRVESSAVFLTQLPAPQSAKAVIKFIPAEPAADLQLSLWRRASQLNHPNLLRLFHSGRCRLADNDLLYAVMEFAEEDLSQILPQRPLTPEETRDMLAPVLDALAYLHGHGLVHSRVKPSNILATGDQLKLSSDTFFPVGESPKSRRATAVYDAPDSGPLSASADVWSLGVTLVEALTQHAPALPPDRQADPLIPDSLPQPFLDIARHALVRDPKRRWTIAEIAARLNPSAAVATTAAPAPSASASVAASASAISPLAIPLSPVPPVPAAKLPTPKLEPPARRDTPPPRPQAVSPRPRGAMPRPQQTFVLPNYFVPLLAAIFIIVAIFALPKILARRSESSSSASTTSASQPKPVQPSASREIAPPAQPAQQNSSKASSGKKSLSAKDTAQAALGSPSPSASASSSSAPAITTAPASLRTDTFPSANAPSSSADSPARGEVLDQVLPDVSGKARATIHGVVRVTVRVQVDPAGAVSDALLDSPGPSQYFADLALKAARRWQFTSPELNGHSVPSTWLIQFHFSSSGTKAFPKQTAP